MTTLSEAFDHLVYWWDRLLCRALPTFGVMLGEPAAEFPPPPTTDPLGGVSFADACTGIKRAQRLGYLARPLPQEFELADSEAFLDPINGRSWIWTSGEFIRRANDPVIDTNEYVTFRWSCPDCDQRSFATFATPAEAEHYLTSHLGRYCKGVDHREAL